MHTSYIQNTLGEDAENVAWDIFLNEVHYHHLEARGNMCGYLKKRLHYLLITKALEDKFPKDYASIDELEFALEDKHDSFRDAESKIVVECLMKELEPYQKELVYRRIFVDEPLKNIDSTSRANQYYRLKRALKLIKVAYEKENP
ncbi:MAG: hypothetical protein Q4D21_10570 [Phascolarctobacterium sp.]|nr:hypothetical protein [Phascolarctobacterium sp.]